MKNFCLTGCYDVGSMYGNTSFQDYKKLTQLCCESFLKNLKNVTDITVLEGKKVNYHELFKELYYKGSSLALENATKALRRT